MRIHVITNLFAPDQLAGAALFTDLALFLKERGHDVRITCTFSYYPAWKRLPEDEGLTLRDEVFQGIPVRRVGMHVPAQPTGKARMISDGSFLTALVRHGRHPGWEPQVVLTALPMLSQCMAQRFLYFGKKIPRLIVVQDFVVAAALELGILKLPGFGFVLPRIERWALRSAQTLLTISPSMLEKLRETVGSDRRLRYIPNWIHGSLQNAIDRQSRPAQTRERGMLFYSGNLGVKQGLPDFLNQFRAVDPQKLGWRLKIHGGGAELNRLKAEIAQTPACEFGPVLDEVDYLQALNTTSACLITQKPGLGANFLPSKLLPALATGTPVLAVCERNSPLGQEVIAGACGEVIEPGDNAALAAVLKSWQENPAILAAMGKRALDRARQFQRNEILGQYEQELLALVPGAA